MFRSLTHFAVAVIFMFVAAGCQSMTGETTAEHLTDTGITSAVKTKMAAERAGTLTEVNVKTVDKTVHLTGIVRSAEDKRRATEVARGVEGVKEVKNNLEVRPQ